MPVVDVVMFSEQKEGSESFVGTWLKQTGEAVSEFEPIVEISTDKVSMEIAASASGTLKEILKAEGDPVAPGEVLARIETGVAEAAASARAPAAAQASEASAVKADVSALSPAVRRLIEEHRLDPSIIPATGRDHRLTYQDVANFIEQQKTVKRASRMVPHSPMRRSIATHMARSMQNAPHVTSGV